MTDHKELIDRLRKGAVYIHEKGSLAVAEQDLREAADAIQAQAEFIEDLNASIANLNEVHEAKIQALQDEAGVWAKSQKDLLHDFAAASTGTQKEIAKLREVLLDCREYFDGRADADQPSGEQPTPNEEMTLLVGIDEVLATAKD